MTESNDPFGSHRPKRYLVGIPFVLLVLLVLPLAVILAPLAVVACLAIGVDPVEFYHTLWRILTALRGTHVEYAERDYAVLFRIS